MRTISIGGLVEARQRAAVEEVPDHPVLALGLAEEVDRSSAAPVEVLEALHGVHVVPQPRDVVRVGPPPPLEDADAGRRAALVRPLERLPPEAQELLHAASRVLDAGARLEPEAGGPGDFPGWVDDADRLLP
jgi:hypothetical protein